LIKCEHLSLLGGFEQSAN